MRKRDERRESLVSVGSVYSDSVFTSRGTFLSPLAEIFTTSEQFCKECQNETQAAASLLGIGYIRGLWYPGLPKSQSGQRGCVKCGDLTPASSRRQTVSKIEGTWRQTINTVIPTSINQKVTSLSVIV